MVGEARDTSAWLGNKLQQEAFDKLYSVAERVRLCDDRRLKQDWNYLQASDHFFYMATKHFADGAVHSHFSPYDTPLQAFTNYMNVLADFIVRVEEQYPLTIDNEELNSLLTTIRNQEREIEQLNKEVSSMRQNLEHYNEEHLLRQKQTETAEKPAPAKRNPGANPRPKRLENSSRRSDRQPSAKALRSERHDNNTTDIIQPKTTSGIISA